MKNSIFILVTVLFASCGSSKYYFNKRLEGISCPPEIIEPEILQEYKIPPDTAPDFKDELSTLREKSLSPDTIKEELPPAIIQVELKDENNSVSTEAQKYPQKTAKNKKQESEKSNRKRIIILIVVILLTLIAIIAIRVIMVNMFITALSSI